MSYDERVLDLCDMDYESAEQTCRYIDRLRDDHDALRDAYNDMLSTVYQQAQELARLRDTGNALAGLVERWFNSFPEPLDPTIALDAWRSAAGAPTEETDHG